MLNEELFALVQACGSVGDLHGIKFAYAVVKNRAKVQSAIAVLRDLPNHPKTDEFEQKKQDLIGEHCAKDEAGDPIMQGQSYPGLNDNEEFKALFEALKEEYKEVLEQGEKNNVIFRASLKEEADITLHMITMKDVPDNISPKQLDGISCMIKDFDEE